MSRPRSGSFSGRPRSRSNSQSHVNSAITAIQQKTAAAAAAAAAVDAGPGVFSPGTGGFIGGPPVTGVVEQGVVVNATGTSAGGAAARRRASVRHRKDLSHYTLNGKRVRTTDRICSEVSDGLLACFIFMIPCLTHFFVYFFNLLYGVFFFCLLCLCLLFLLSFVDFLVG